jgi:hypothetical protein
VVEADGVEEVFEAVDDPVVEAFGASRLPGRVLFAGKHIKLVIEVPLLSHAAMNNGLGTPTN